MKNATNYLILGICAGQKIDGAALFDTRVSLVNRKGSANPLIIVGKTMRLDVPETEQPVSWEVLSGSKWVKIVKRYNNQGIALKFLKARKYKMKVTTGTEVVKFEISVRKKWSSPIS